MDAVQKNKISSASSSVVNILHLSDLHFGVDKADKSEYEWVPTAEEHEEILNMLIGTLLDVDLVPDEWRPDIVAISGDIAWSGQPEDYEKFQVFAEKLLPVLRDSSTNKTDKILICPGNHDIVRDLVNNKYWGMIPRPQKDMPIHSMNSEDLKIPEITYEAIVKARWNHFEHFVKTCCNNNPEKLCRAVTFSEWPWLHFLILNSAWDCRNKHDEGTLRVGLKVARKLYADIESPTKEQDIIVAIFHHPSFEISEPDLKTHIERPHQWLHESERVNPNTGGQSFTDFLKTRVDIILNGHVHRMREPERMRGRPIHFVNGTVYSNDSFTFHCRIIQLGEKGESLYMDMYREISATGQKWRVVKPVDPTAMERRNEVISFEGLVQSAANNLGSQYNNILPVLSSVLLGLAIEQNVNIFSMEELSKAIAKLGNSPTLIRRKGAE